MIERLVWVEHTCVVPCRSMSDNLALIEIYRDSYLNALDCNVCIASLDSEKTFDRISHDYLKQELVRFGFSPLLRAWIHLL